MKKLRAMLRHLVAPGYEEVQKFKIGFRVNETKKCVELDLNTSLIDYLLAYKKVSHKLQPQNGKSST